MSWLFRESIVSHPLPWSIAAPFVVALIWIGFDKYQTYRGDGALLLMLIFAYAALGAASFYGFVRHAYRA